MNRNIPLFRSGGLLALFLIGLGVTALQAETVKAVVESVKGTVEFAPPGSSAFSSLKKGQELAVGSTIRTGGDGTADIVTTPGSAIQVGNNSNLRLNALAFARTGSAVTERQAHIELTKGVVSALIDPSTPKITDFQVQTPEGAAAARGTFYAVMVSHGRTYVSVEQGKVGAIANSKNH
jgi:hypothetical protein